MIVSKYLRKRNNIIKNHFMKRFIKLFIFIIFCFAGYEMKAQLFDAELMQKLQGKTKLSEIIKEAEQYIKPRIRAEVSGDKYFKQLKLLHRWSLYMSNRLVGDGHITDVNKRNNDAFEKARYSINGRTESTLSSYGSFSFIAPTSVNSADLRLGIGRCDRITFHPTDPEIIYISTPAGGLWRTINDGASWVALTNHLPTLGISGMVIDYNNTNTLYVLTGDGDSDIGGFVEDFGYMRSSTGVYKSTDGGVTWNPTGTLSVASYTGYKLVQDPDEPNTLLAATSRGVYRTTNGGTSWTLVTASARFYDIEYDPNGNDRVYIAGNGLVQYSTNSGIDWTTATFDISIASAGRVELAVTPNNTAYVYALTGNATSNGFFSGLYRSTNNGVSFTRRCNSPNIMDGSQLGDGDGSQGSYDLALAVSNLNAERVVTGGVNIWSSTNGGSTMSAIMFDGGGNRKIHVDIHDLKFNPLNNVLYSANDGGVFRSADNGTSWTKISDGINVSQIYHIAGIESNSNILTIGLQDNGLKSRTVVTSSFNHNGTGDGYGVAIKANDVTNGYGGINRSVYTMDLNGGLANEFQGKSEFYPTIAVHPTLGNTVYAGWSDIYKSTDGGLNYTNKTGNGGWSMVTCPSNTTRVYAAGGFNGYGDDASGSLQRSDNSGDSWTTIFNSSDATFSKITSVAVDPSNSNNVWITLGGYNDGVKIFRSGNAGGNWTNVTGSLPNVPFNCIAISSNNDAYAGSDFGIFYRGSGQTDWQPFSTNLPRVPVTGLVINETAGLIRAATFGRGIYSAALYSNCVANLALNSTYGGNDYYEASSTITSTGDLTGGAGTQVFFKAGESVTLSDGFTAAAGNEFKAYLGPCGNGVPTMKTLEGALAASPSALGFEKFGFVEVMNTTGMQCQVDVELKTQGQVKIILTDDSGAVLQEKTIHAGSGRSSNYLNYKFDKAKNYRVTLSLDNNIVHWQEVVLR